MQSTGTCTTTFQMKLFCKHLDWLERTKHLFNQVQDYYYTLLLHHSELLLLSNQSALREMERLTIKSRSGELPRHKLPFDKVPVYFRRAAINSAIALIHNYQSNCITWQRNKEMALQRGEIFPVREPGIAKNFQTSPLFYKGMYKEFLEDSILLKLYTGKSWCWVKCRYKGRQIPLNAEKLSPTIVLKKSGPKLHIPVKTNVCDARTVKERMDDNERVCGITFSNTDVFVAGAVYSADGRIEAVKFIRGGRQFTHHSKRLIDKINSNRKNMGKQFDWKGANHKYWKHLSNLRDFWSHQVSSNIIKFCVENQVKTISIVKETKEQKDQDNTSREMKRIIFKKLGVYGTYSLSLLIKRMLQYKAWKNGIVITGVQSQYTSCKCAKCRGYLIKKSNKNSGFLCKNGHQGNRYLNTARNIAITSMKKFGKQCGAKLSYSEIS